MNQQRPLSCIPECIQGHASRQFFPCVSLRTTIPTMLLQRLPRPGRQHSVVRMIGMYMQNAYANSRHINSSSKYCLSTRSSCRSGFARDSQRRHHAIVQISGHAARRVLERIVSVVRVSSQSFLFEFIPSRIPSGGTTRRIEKPLQPGDQSALGHQIWNAHAIKIDRLQSKRRCIERANFHIGSLARSWSCVLGKTARLPRETQRHAHTPFVEDSSHDTGCVYLDHAACTCAQSSTVKPSARVGRHILDDHPSRFAQESFQFITVCSSRQT